MVWTGQDRTGQETLGCIAAVMKAETYFLLLSPSHHLSALFIQDIPDRTGFLGYNPLPKHLFPIVCLEQTIG